jgi:hypothetical protein
LADKTLSVVVGTVGDKVMLIVNSINGFSVVVDSAAAVVGASVLAGVTFSVAFACVDAFVVVAACVDGSVVVVEGVNASAVGGIVDIKTQPTGGVIGDQFSKNNKEVLILIISVYAV